MTVKVKKLTPVFFLRYPQFSILHQQSIYRGKQTCSSKRESLEFMTKRLFDIIVAISATIIFLAPFLAIVVAVKMSSKGPVFYWSKRVGQNSEYFMMPKFRTMRVETPEISSDMLQNPYQYMTFIGPFLRKTSLDELPQLISVLKGNMSIVGPRPALHTQHDLIAKRRAMQIDTLLPGITGWAQINGRDDIELGKKLELDRVYLQNQNLLFDIKILFLTVLAVIGCSGVTH